MFLISQLRCYKENIDSIIPGSSLEQAGSGLAEAG